MKLSTKLLFLMLLATMTGRAQTSTTTLVHYWAFENTPTYHNPGIPGIKATYSLIDTNKAQVVYKLATGASSTYAGYIDPVGGDTMNARMGAAAGNGLRVRNPTDSMELRIYAPTNGYKGKVSIKYEVQSSSLTSGMLAQLFDYSVDSGTTWKTTNLNMTIDSISQPQFQSSWGLISINFGTDTTQGNNAKFVFRIKFAGNTNLTSGNNRFDNLTVETTTSATGIANVAAQSSFALYPNPATDRVTLKTEVTGSKKVAVYNAYGQSVMNLVSEATEINLPVAALPAGVYYTSISVGAHTEVKTFVKN